MNFLIFLFNVVKEIVKAIFIRKVWPISQKTIHGEIALITGGGHGMGRLLALKLGSLGAKVVIVDINESYLNESTAFLKKSGIEVCSYICDVSIKKEIKELAKHIKDNIGDVSILVNNAGVTSAGDIVSMTEKSIEKVFEVNLMSNLWFLKEFLPDMIEKNHGHVVAMASIAGRVSFPYASTYSATKHAVIGYMDALRRELRWEGKYGVKTTYACPAYVNTGFVKGPVTKHLNLLEPEFVVDKIMEAILTDQPFVDIPQLPFPLQLFWNLVPDSVRELIVDYNRFPLSFDEMKEQTRVYSDFN